MSNIFNENSGEGTSGYTNDLDKEIGNAAPINIESNFVNITPLYVSASGHTRLFTATRYGKIYVLKGLKPDFMYTPVYRQALTKEFEIGLQLDHTYICRTIGMEEVDGYGAMIVMEHVDGDTLKDLIDNKTLTVKMARRIMSQLADALDYMHNKQITHRDLKPANIMVTHNGHNVKLIDFSLSDSDVFTVLKLPAGTSGYIAPEQFFPGAKATPMADIYSFGMVIKKMATITNDSYLARIANICTRRNANDRPANKEQILTAANSNKKLRTAITLLAIISTALAIYIGIELYTRSTVVTQKPLSTETDSLSGENIIIDYPKWPPAK